MGIVHLQHMTQMDTDKKFLNLNPDLKPNILSQNYCGNNCLTSDTLSNSDAMFPAITMMPNQQSPAGNFLVYVKIRQIFSVVSDTTLKTVYILSSTSHPTLVIQP